MVVVEMVGVMVGGDVGEWRMGWGDGDDCGGGGNGSGVHPSSVASSR